MLEQFREFTQTALFEFIVANLGVAATLTGIVGLAMGGNLPGLRVPRALRPWMKLALALTLMVGVTLIAAAPPNLLERVIGELTS